MSRFFIDIEASIKAKKLINKGSIVSKVLENAFPFLITFFYFYISLLKFISDFTENKPILLSLLLLIFSILLSSLVIYSIINLKELKRIQGLSRNKNKSIVENIIKKNNWKTYSTNTQITIINFSWQDSGLDWGKQMTILYNENDILINCISFGLGSIPSPFHWFANKRKVNKLKIKFENEIKRIS